jgi:hypothetical protein
LLLSTVRALSEHLNIGVKVLPFDPPLAIIAVGPIFREPALRIVQDFLDGTKNALRTIPRTNGLTPLQGKILC